MHSLLKLAFQNPKSKATQANTRTTFAYQMKKNPKILKYLKTIFYHRGKSFASTLVINPDDKKSLEIDEFLRKKNDLAASNEFVQHKTNINLQDARSQIANRNPNKYLSLCPLK